jgi:hypothetical protein
LDSAGAGGGHDLKLVRRCRCEEWRGSKQEKMEVKGKTEATSDVDPRLLLPTGIFTLWELRTGTEPQLLQSLFA